MGMNTQQDLGLDPPQTFVTVNSCSGGKTSSYMYLNYPTDHSIFAVVLSNSPENRPRDKGLLREVQDRIPWFEGSMELEQTLRAILEIEQLGQREITWVASDWTYEELVLGQTNIPGKQSPLLPDKTHRFCTQWLKLYPIFDHCFSFLMSHGQILMNIGFRFDEAKRVHKYDNGCKLNKISYSHQCDITGRFRGKHRWKKDFHWREIDFPLYRDRVTKEDVVESIVRTGVVFPEISNCSYCFFHRSNEHQRQFQLNPEQAAPWIRLEKSVSDYHQKDHSFDKKASLEEILFSGADNNPGVSGCMCTD